jgi:hypothetical protein
MPLFGGRLLSYQDVPDINNNNCKKVIISGKDLNHEKLLPKIYDTVQGK